MNRIKLHIVSRAGFMNSKFPDFQTLIDKNIHPDDIPERFYCGGCGVWVFQTLLYLNFYYNKKFDFSWGEACRFDAINFMHNDHFGSRVKPWAGVTVVARADRPPVFGADYVIEQNPVKAKSAEHIFMPHWPQPGIKPRERNDNMVKTVAYFGSKDSLPEEYCDDHFRDQLEQQGITLKISFDNWTDYQDVDVCLSFRKKHDYKLLRKPASKLINSWLGETVMICDDEPSFRSLRTGENDYLIASSPEETFYQIMKLKHSPALYQAMREQGQKRIREYTKENIAERWCHFFENVWDKGLNNHSAPFRFLRFMMAKAIHPLTERF